MISYGKLRDRINLPATDDGELKGIVDIMVGLFEQETGRLWTRRVDHVEYFTPDPTKRIESIFLELWPIEAITKVEEKRRIASAWTELTASQYCLLDPSRNRLDRVGTRWAEQVRVTYTGGYVYNPAQGQFATPREIHEAILVQAAFAQSRLQIEKLVTRSKSSKGGAEVYLDADFHPLFQAVVNANRRKV